MTTIELHFFEAAVRFFREQSNQKIDWEQRRFQAASLILAGMCSNYAHPIPTISTTEDAVRIADHLIKILSDSNRTLKCAK
ncbi:hypothetical protein [Sodaliphilus pleomorphus]|uniref:Uncharacterized protein n=1 Tax=Sodaliphilus pleomorphus TaxID=2606626 RepID=A0A6L5XGZ8_9BACT|nr:hypothetical protein [Sodaliphilus pleomorphus]MSS18799.1 hypothetical protein [Sodaliphilus pleomorphus]